MQPPGESPKSVAHGWKAWSAKKKLLICAGILFIIVAVAVGLGVGLGVGLSNRGGGAPPPASPSPAPTSTSIPTPMPSAPYTGWQPDVGTSWQIELLNPLNNTSFNASVYDIDLFMNNKSTISNLQSMHRKVICYFSAGTYEDWRPDAHEFSPADLGKPLSDWPGERWLDTNSENVRHIMATRLDMAQSKGCDGVDPDNVDGYSNANGLGLTKDDAINYVNWLANESHARNMAVGLKNADAIIESVIDNMQWSVNEQCAEYDECPAYEPFPRAGKPVFHIEYPKGDVDNNRPVTAQQLKDACDFPESSNFSTIIKNMNLDYWIEICP